MIIQYYRLIVKRFINEYFSLSSKEKARLGIKEEFIRRYRYVANVSTLLGFFMIFRTIYIIIIYQNKTGILKENINNLLSSFEYKLIGTLTIIMIGYGLFELKKRAQIIYGILETAFAVATTYTIVDNTQKVLLRGKIDIYLFLPVLTTLYLIVRGLTNVYEGNKKIEIKLRAELDQEVLS